MRTFNPSEQPFPVDCLPKFVEDAVWCGTHLANAPLAICAASALTALSTACKNVRVVLPLSDRVRSTALAVLVVAEPGERKSTCNREFFAAIREHDRNEVVQSEEAHASYLAAASLWKVKQKTLMSMYQNAIRGNRNAGDVEQQLTLLELSKPKLPRAQRILHQDASIRAVFETIQGQGRSIAIGTDEWGVVSETDLYKNFGFLNLLWDGGPLDMERAGGKSISAVDVHSTMWLMMQTSVFEGFQKRTNARKSGFISRCLSCRPNSLIGQRFINCAKPSRAELDVFNQRIAEMLNDEKPITLTFGCGVALQWREFVNSCEMGVQNGWFRDVQDIAAKAPENAARLAAIMHHAGGKAGEISEDTFVRATVIVKWFLEQARYMFDESCIARCVDDSRRLENFLCDHLRWTNQLVIDRNEVLRNWGVRNNTQRFEAALQTLVLQGKVELGVAIGSKKRVVRMHGLALNGLAIKLNPL